MSPVFLTYGRVRKGDASLSDARSFTGQDAWFKDAGNQSACGVHGYWYEEVNRVLFEFLGAVADG